MLSLKSSKYIKYVDQSNSYYGPKTNLNRWVFSLDIKELRVSADWPKDLHKQIRSKCENIQGSWILLQVSVTIITPFHYTHTRTRLHAHTQAQQRDIQSPSKPLISVIDWEGGAGWEIVRTVADGGIHGRLCHSYSTALPGSLSCIAMTSVWHVKYVMSATAQTIRLPGGTDRDMDYVCASRTYSCCHAVGNGLPTYNLFNISPWKC